MPCYLRVDSMGTATAAERIGIVLGCIIIVSLPAGLITSIFLSDPAFWQLFIAWVVPGVLVGVLLAYNKLPVSYHELWFFGMLSWILTLLLWNQFQVDFGNVAADQNTAIWTMVVGVVIAALVTWLRPRIRRNRSAS